MDEGCADIDGLYGQGVLSVKKRGRMKAPQPILLTFLHEVLDWTSQPCKVAGDDVGSKKSPLGKRTTNRKRTSFLFTGVVVRLFNPSAYASLAIPGGMPGTLPHERFGMEHVRLFIQPG
jgi:hypothetical protein